MEFRAASDIANYVQAGRDICRTLGVEFEVTAGELAVLLERESSGKLGDRFSSRRAARKVTRRLRRAAAHQQAAGDELIRFWKDFATTYGELLNPKRRAKGFQWEK